jgi:hypothetical protein
MEPVYVDPNHPVVRHLWPLGPEAPAVQRVAATITAFNEATGRNISHPLTQVDATAIHQWLLDEEWNMPKNSEGHSAVLLRQPVPVSLPLVHSEISEKIGWLGQARCITCIPDTTASGRVNFAIRARPFSAQSLRGDKLQRMKRLIGEYLHERHHLSFMGQPNRQFCVSIVAVVPETERRKDVDNLVKGLLDAMQGTVYENDRQIQHLSTRRVPHDGTEGHYHVQIQPVLDARADVISQKFDLGWLQDEITLD